MSNQNELVQKAIDDICLKYSNGLISDEEACLGVEALIENRIKEIMTVDCDSEYSEWDKLRMIRSRIRYRNRFLEGISIGGLVSICTWKMIETCVSRKNAND